MTLVSSTRAMIATAAVAVGLGLGGCVTVLPKEKPVQLYRFDVTGAGRSAPVAGGRVALAVSSFLPAASRGDGVLTLRGDQAAYVSEARWVTPAAVMFHEAVTGALEAEAPHVRVLRAGDAGAAGLRLRIDVRHFEVVYDASRGGAPEVHLQALLQLSDATGGGASKSLDLHVPAAANRISAIVSAFDQAVSQTAAASAALAESAAAPVSKAP